jgi:hypothetical protein
LAFSITILVISATESFFKAGAAFFAFSSKPLFLRALSNFLTFEIDFDFDFDF